MADFIRSFHDGIDVDIFHDGIVDGIDVRVDNDNVNGGDTRPRSAAEAEREGGEVRDRGAEGRGAQRRGTEGRKRSGIEATDVEERSTSEEKRNIKSQVSVFE